MILHYKAILGQIKPGWIRLILLWIMPLAQDQSLDLLASSPALYHCTTDASTNQQQNTVLYPAQLNNKLKTLLHIIIIAHHVISDFQLVDEICVFLLHKLKSLNLYPLGTILCLQSLILCL